MTDSPVRYGNNATTARVHLVRRRGTHYIQLCGMSRSQRYSLFPLNETKAREIIAAHPELACKRCGVADDFA